MKTLLTPRRRIAAAAALLVTSGLGGAQSLGTPTTQAWIGRPLEVTIPARVDGPGQEDGCVRAEVWFGGVRVPDQRVQAVLVRRADATLVRVSTSSPVDEPMLSLVVRAGCGNTLTRRYTLLAEPLPEPLQAAAPANEAADAAAVALRTVGAQRALPPLPAARAMQAAWPAADWKAKPQRVSVRPPRLQLEARGALLETPALLRISDSLADPAGDAARRATAALLWQAINAPPEQLLRNSALLHQLEQEIASLRDASQRTRQGIVRAQAELASLPSVLAERGPMPAGPVPSARSLQAWPGVVAGLLAALLAAGGLAWWLRRPRAEGRLRASSWFAPRSGRQADTDWVERTVVDPRVSEPPLSEPPRSTLPVPEVPASVAAPPVAEPLPVPRAHPPVPVLPVQRVEALMTAMQETEFLLTLGMAEDAKKVLRRYLRDASAPASIAFYELVVLCHHTRDAEGLMEARRQFHEVFRAPAPPVEDLLRPSGADDHARLMERISAAWPSPRVMKMVERRLFSAPSDEDLALSLQGWRDLVWLYGIVREMLEAGTTLGPTDAPESQLLAPWAEEEEGEMATGVPGEDFGSPSHFGLDLALDLETAQEAKQVRLLENVVPAPAPSPPSAPAAPPDPDDPVDSLWNAVLATESRRSLR